VQKRAVIGITGMPGSGKNTVREIVREFGFPIVVMGDEVRAEAERRGLDLTPENLGKVMLQVREEGGPGVLARRCIPKIKALNSPVIVVDGIRSMHEVREYKKEFPSFKIVAVDASPKTRFDRLLKRGRTDDPKDWETFVERDERELSVGIGEVIESADYAILNDGTRKEFRKSLKQLLTRELRDDRTR